jgi:hypothetical protein
MVLLEIMKKMVMTTAMVKNQLIKMKKIKQVKQEAYPEPQDGIGITPVI